MTITNAHQQDTTITSLTDTIHEVETKKLDSLPNMNGSLFSMDPPTSGIPANVSPPPSRPRPMREQVVNSHRTLILLFDGTGDQFDAENSNIVQLCSLLKKEDRSKQMIYYQAGIGTYTSCAEVNPLVSKISMACDMMFAKNLPGHVMDGYKFLMQNYTAGDHICIFGFSRGAYTARSLAGMLHKVGLLPADNFQQVRFAYKMYSRVDRVGWEQSTAFKQAFSRDVTINFVGVWDTVDSVGLIPRRLPFTTSNTIIRTFRHALSLDERRARFRPNLWNLPHPSAAKEVPQEGRPSLPGSSRHSSGREHTRQISKSPKQRLSPLRPSLEWDSTEDNRLSEFEEQFSEHDEYNHRTPTDVKEVWFAGCHCDVGGGSVKNATRHSLARISLRWMVRECFKSDTGIMFDSQRLRSIGLDPSTLVKPRPPPISGENQTIEPCPLTKKKPLWRRLVKVARKLLPVRETGSSSGSPAPMIKVNEKEKSTDHMKEEEEDLEDALSPKYDQLRIAPLWWILELMPMRFREQRRCDEWVSSFGSNLAQPRVIPEQDAGVCVHRSVKTRMEAEKIRSDGKSHCKYLPKAKFDVDQATWVD